MRRPGFLFAIVGLLTASRGVAADEAPAPVRVAVTVPSGGWSLKIGKVYEVGEEIWVLAEVRNRGGIAVQVISDLEATAPVTPAADQKVRTFVGGATWNWRGPDAGAVEFVDDLQVIDKRAKEAGGTLLHKAPEEPPARAQFIVTFRKDLFKDGTTAEGRTLEEVARDCVARVDGEVKSILGIIHGCSAVLTPQAAEQLRQSPEVAAVEQDGPIQGSSLVEP